MEETLKIRLLKAVGNESVMRAVLLDCMDRAQAEYCGFYTARERELVYVMCESGELAIRVPEIADKLRASFRMFTNGLRAESGPDLKVYYRRERSHVAYLLTSPRIESYFLVPLAFGSKVRGVLFIGSVRREAFGRADIAAFRNLAEEGEQRSPVLFRVGGERDILERLLAALPYGAALVAHDGEIAASNKAFAHILRIREGTPDSVYRIAALSPFSLQGIWDEFSILQRDVKERELRGSEAPERTLAVSWMSVEGLVEGVGSIVLVRDVTASREHAEMREDMIALVAHELRTPLAALKSSLSIVAESGVRDSRAAACSPEPVAGGSPGGEDAARRFLANARRTVERLGMLVDGLIDSSAARIDERPMRIDLHDVQAFLDDSTSLFIEPMRKKGIEFRTFVDPEAACFAFDRDRIEQVVQNLLANSIKHVPAGGAVAITVIPCVGCPMPFVPRPILGRVGRLAFADICVRDTGAGIPLEVARVMNESGGAVIPSFRGSKGLGLHVAQRLVLLHGGMLHIEEGVAGGSAVHLYLPADEATARVVLQCRAADMRLEEMLSRGLTPVLYCIENEERIPWERVLANTLGGAAVNPHRSETPDGELLVWPLGSELAIALHPRDRGGDVIPDGLRADRAVARRDGMNLRELAEAAMDNAKERGAAEYALKGAAE